MDIAVVIDGWRLMGPGLVMTLLVSASVMILGLGIGLLGGLSLLYGPPLLRLLVRAYVDFVRGTPLLVLIFLIFYGIPAVGIPVPELRRGRDFARRLRRRPDLRAGARRHQLDPQGTDRRFDGIGPDLLAAAESRGAAASSRAYPATPGEHHRRSRQRFVARLAGQHRRADAGDRTGGAAGAAAGPALPGGGAAVLCGQLHRVEQRSPSGTAFRILKTASMSATNGRAPTVTNSGEAIIAVEGLRKFFGTHEVLRGVDLAVRVGEVVVVIGPSGSGKTTLLRCLNFLEEYQHGDVYIDGQLMGYRDRQRAPTAPIGDARSPGCERRSAWSSRASTCFRI